MADGTEIDSLFVSLGVDLSGLQKGVRDAKKTLQDGLDIKRAGRKAERSLDDVEDALDDVHDQAERADDALGDVKRALRDIDRVGLVGAATGIDDDQVELMGTLGSIFPKIASASGPAAAGIAGVGAAIAAVTGVAALSAGLTTLAASMARDFGSKELQNEFAALDAEVNTLKRTFVREFTPVLEEGVLPFLRGLTRVASAAVDELASMTEGVIDAAKALQGAPGILGMLSTGAVALAAVGQGQGDDLGLERLREVFEGVNAQMDVLREKFERGLIPREEMLRQMAAIRERIIDDLLMIQATVPDAGVELVIRDQVEKLKRLRAEIQRLLQQQQATPTLTDPRAGEAVPTLGPQQADASVDMSQVPDRLEGPDTSGVRESLSEAGVQAASRTRRAFASALGAGVGDAYQAAFAPFIDSIESDVASALVSAMVQAVASAAAQKLTSVLMGGGQQGPAMGPMGGGAGGIIGTLIGTGLSAVIPGLASGGVVTAPTLAVVGEGRESEAVLPLSRLEGMLAASGGGGASTERMGQEMRALRSEVRALASRPVRVRVGRRTARDIDERASRYNNRKSSR